MYHRDYKQLRKGGSRVDGEINLYLVLIRLRKIFPFVKFSFFFANVRGEKEERVEGKSETMINSS